MSIPRNEPDPRDAEVEELHRRLARLHAKHRKFADETNRILTEQHREIARLRAAASERTAS